MSPHGFDLRTRSAPQLGGRGARVSLFAALVASTLASSGLEPSSSAGEMEMRRGATGAERQPVEVPQRPSGSFAPLGMDGRARMLRRCHRSVGPCDRVVLELLEASSDREEQERLAALNESALGSSERRLAL